MGLADKVPVLALLLAQWLGAGGAVGVIAWERKFASLHGQSSMAMRCLTPVCGGECLEGPGVDVGEEMLVT